MRYSEKITDLPEKGVGFVVNCNGRNNLAIWRENNKFYTVINGKKRRWNKKFNPDIRHIFNKV